MTMDLRAGSEIGGYVLDAYVGGGSFGAVWRGHDGKTAAPVAIKLLTGVFSDKETSAMRANMELLAAAAARTSEHIVHVLGGGVEPVPYIVMEYIEGSDLAQVIKDQGKLDARLNRGRRTCGGGRAGSPLPGGDYPSRHQARQRHD